MSLVFQLKMLAFLSISLLVSGVLSNDIQVSRRYDLAATEPNTPDSDAFSNPGCLSSTCLERSSCDGPPCCECQCIYNHPNYLVGKAACTSNADTNSETAANCKYRFRPNNEPPEVLALTKETTGKKKFPSDSERINCSSPNVVISKWQFLDAHGRWNDGAGDIFTVDHKTVGGKNHDKKDNNFLKWDGTLGAQYEGLIVKFSVTCDEPHREVGCVLAKILGNHTYDTTPTPETYTTSSPSSTLSNSLPSSSSPSETTTQSPSTAYTTEAGLGGDAGKRIEKDNNKDSSKAAVGPGLGVLGGLVILVVIAMLLALLYKRRKKSTSTERSAVNNPEYESQAASLGIYQDPIYVELPNKNQTAGEFDNPVYLDPAEESSNRKSRQGPLPAIPGTESTYQPLCDVTRIGPAPPVPPPVSYSKKFPSEPLDYENPVKKGETPSRSADYEIPLATENSPVVQNTETFRGQTELSPTTVRDDDACPEYLELEPPNGV